MKSTQISPTRGDCTASYSITDYKATTVGEFINEVLTECPNEWGYIEDNNHHRIAEYKYGKVVTNNATAELRNKQIIKIIGNGGWSCMDYLITLREEE